MNKRVAVIGICTFLITMLLALVAYGAFSVKYFYVQINGTSMVPVFEDGDTVIFEKVKGEPKQGDFAIFTLPDSWKPIWKGNDDTRLIKRIAVLPGQTLSWDGENWYRDGEQFSYVKSGACQVEPTEYTLGPDEYFVTGDTTIGQTLDSREAFCNDAAYTVDSKHLQQVGTLVKVY